MSEPCEVILMGTPEQTVAVCCTRHGFLSFDVRHVEEAAALVAAHALEQAP